MMCVAGAACCSAREKPEKKANPVAPQPFREARFHNLTCRQDLVASGLSKPVWIFDPAGAPGSRMGCDQDGCRLASTWGPCRDMMGRAHKPEHWVPLEPNRYGFGPPTRALIVATIAMRSSGLRCSGLGTC